MDCKADRNSFLPIVPLLSLSKDDQRRANGTSEQRKHLRSRAADALSSGFGGAAAGAEVSRSGGAFNAASVDVGDVLRGWLGGWVGGWVGGRTDIVTAGFARAATLETALSSLFLCAGSY